MFKGRTALPLGANSVSDSNEIEKFAITSHKSTWAPLVFFLGPCFSLKKVQFGRPVEHINYRDTARLYESIPTETAVLVWSNAAHEGTIKALRQTIVHGTSMHDRLQSEVCSEMKLCALYFTQRITKKEFQEQMRRIISDDFVYESFQMALRRMRNEKIALKLTNTLQLFIPEIQSDVRTESTTKLKWAVKYNPEVISFDEGNLLVETFDIQDALMFANKYGRKIRIARWGAEIPDVPLCELLYRSLLDFLQTGRYVDCEYVARARTFAENKSLNGLNQLATAEDIAFDYGYLLDKDGFITKLHKPLTPILGKKFFVADLFRTKKVDSPTAEKDMKSPRRVSSFLSAITSKSSAESAPDNYHTIERQIQRELGINDPVLPPTATTTAARPAGSVVSAETGTMMGKDSEEEGSLALIVAEAARNAQKVRRETNWVAFLNHKVPSSVTATYIRSKKGVTLPQKGQTPPAPTAVSTRVEGSAEQDALAGLGSYTYGLGAKKPYKPAQSGAADAAAVTGHKDLWVETTEISAPLPVYTEPGKDTAISTRTSPKEVEVSPKPAPHSDVPRNCAPHHPQLTPSPPPPPHKTPPPSGNTTVPAEKSNKNKKSLTIVTELSKETEEGEVKERRKDEVKEKQAEQRACETTTLLSPQTNAPLNDTITNSATTATTTQSSDDMYTKESPIECAPDITDTVVPAASTVASDSTPPPLASQATGPVPSMPSISPSPSTSPPSRYSPRARLILTQSDESLLVETLGSASMKGEDSTTTDQAAELAVAAALEKSAAFKSRDVAPAAATAAAAKSASLVARTAQPSATMPHRPVLRAPSAMNMQMAARPLPTPPPLPVRAPPAPVIVPVTVKEKKDVIERRIRSQRTPAVGALHASSALHASTQSKDKTHQVPHIQQQNKGDGSKLNGTTIMPATFAGPDSTDIVIRKPNGFVANQPVQDVSIKPMTQKSLQKKWAFNTITQQGVK